MRNPMIIGFVCQKGGVGKSTMITLFANYLSYIKGKKIVLIDTDGLQNTVYINRSEDKQLLDNSDAIRAAFDAQPFPLLYPVLRCEIDNLHQFLVGEVLSLQDDYDYILVDTRGNLSEESVEAISIFNTVFIPTEVSDSSSKSASFTGKIMQNLIDNEHEDIELKEYFFIWNRINHLSITDSERQELIDADFNLDYFDNRFLKNELPYKMAIQKRNISNTILFPTQDILDSQAPELLPLLEEMYEIIEVQNKKLSSE